MNFHNMSHVHLIGIKGAGMTALAEVMAKSDIRVTGSDTEEVFFTDAVLKRVGISVIEGFSPDNIAADTDLIVYSTAYVPEKNTELKAAFESGIRTISYPEALGELMREKMGLAVCGTHGKTTTSALLAEVLRTVGEDPLAIVGSKIVQWEGNALVGTGKYFVLEADEYQNKFQYYSPFGVVLTSVDWDHPDFFPDVASYRQVFVDLMERIPHHGVLVSCGDSASVVEVARSAHCRKASYGFLEGNDFRIVNHVVLQPSGRDDGTSGIRQTFEVLHGDESLGVFELRLAGKHNALNAAAVIALCATLKLDIEKIREGLRGFFGTARRFEYVGEYAGALVYDDYAHHPEEIKATLRAFRELYPNRRVLAVFHPHTYTRTKALLSEFAQSFDDADEVFVLDIYGSAREEQGGVSSRELVDLINTYARGKAFHVKDVEEALHGLRDKVVADDVVVTLGAGNVWEVAHALAKEHNIVTAKQILSF